MWAQKLSSLPPAASTAPSYPPTPHATSQIFIKSSPGTRKIDAGVAFWQLTLPELPRTHTNTHEFADFLFLLRKVKNKTPPPNQTKPKNKANEKKKNRREEEKLAVAAKAAWFLISEFRQSLGLACVCACMLGVGTCLFSISLHAFSSCALALPLLPSCCKPPFPFKAFWHNELIFPCSLWKPGYVRESCSLRGLF